MERTEPPFNDSDMEELVRQAIMPGQYADNAYTRDEIVRMQCAAIASNPEKYFSYVQPVAQEEAAQYVQCLRKIEADKKRELSMSRPTLLGRLGIFFARRHHGK